MCEVSKISLPKILRQPSTKVKNPNNKKSSETVPYSESLPLRDISVETEFDIIKTLHEGSFSKIHLALRLNSCTKERLALKVIPDTHLEDFYREFNYNYFLSPHPNVVKCYNVSIVWDGSFVFPIEYAPWGNLTRFISQDSCLSETTVKSVAKQLSSALDFIHSLKLVHRDISPENVLVFKHDLSQIKVTDFGATRPEKSLVACMKQESPKEVYYQLPPEICHLVKGENYYVHRSSDVWQLGILIYLLLSGGNEPWQLADDIADPAFGEWVNWLRRKNLKVPAPFQPFAPRLLRLFKRLFEPKPKKRCEAREVLKYLEDEWIIKLYRNPSFRHGMLERKASSSTNRSSNRSSATRSRNSSLKRKSLRQSSKSEWCPPLNANNVKERSIEPPDSLLKISGSGRDKLLDVDKQERVGQWILEAATSAAVITSNNTLLVPQ